MVKITQITPKDLVIAEKSDVKLRVIYYKTVVHVYYFEVSYGSYNDIYIAEMNVAEFCCAGNLVSLTQRS